MAIALSGEASLSGIRDGQLDRGLNVINKDTDLSSLSTPQHSPPIVKLSHLK